MAVMCQPVQWLTKVEIDGIDEEEVDDEDEDEEEDEEEEEEEENQKYSH